MILSIYHRAVTIRITFFIKTSILALFCIFRQIAAGQQTGRLSIPLDQGSFCLYTKAEFTVADDSTVVLFLPDPGGRTSWAAMGHILKYLVALGSGITMRGQLTGLFVQVFQFVSIGIYDVDPGILIVQNTAQIQRSERMPENPCCR